MFVPGRFMPRFGTAAASGHGVACAASGWGCRAATGRIMVDDAALELREATVKGPIAPGADKTIGMTVLFFLSRLVHYELHDGSATTPPITVREVRTSDVSDPTVTTETPKIAR